MICWEKLSYGPVNFGSRRHCFSGDLMLLVTEEQNSICLLTSAITTTMPTAYCALTNKFPAQLNISLKLFPQSSITWSFLSSAAFISRGKNTEAYSEPSEASRLGFLQYYRKKLYLQFLNTLLRIRHHIRSYKYASFSFKTWSYGGP